MFILFIDRSNDQIHFIDRGIVPADNFLGIDWYGFFKTCSIGLLS